MKSLEITNFPQLEYACAEAINTLCTNLTFTGGNMKRILITSCQSGDGKSFMSMNIMRTMASLGKRVVLVDADLRRSILNSRFGIRYSDENHAGLTHFLADMCGSDEIIYSTNIPGGYIIPVGHEVSNSLALLNTPRFTNLLVQLSRQVDYVFVDAPPVGVIIDAAEIARSCDGALFVISYNKTHRSELLSAKQQIEKTGTTVLGTVLNNVEFNSYSSRKYYNKYYYSNYTSDYYKVKGRADKR